MARRKQRKPQHLENERDLAESLQNGIGSGSDTEEDEHVCGKCRAEFPSLSTFLEHKKLCVSKRPVLVHPPEDSSMDSDDDEEGDENSERLSPQEIDRNLLSQQTSNSFLMANLNPLLMLIQQQNRTDNIFLEELKNTSVAVAQHSNPADGIREFLSKFRKTQVENLQIIRSLEHIVLQNLFAASGPTALNGAAAALTPLQNAEGPSVASSAPSSTNLAEYPQGSRTEEDPSVPVPENTIALLEKHTERYLQDSMRGPTFMLNGIDDDKSKRGKTDDPSARHRCAYCGKMLGSDSALQIHIRSHTGEKPFTCEVCKSSFSTRGNLKVHFQRHKENPEELLALSATMVDAQRKAQELRNGERRPENPPLLYPNDTNHRGESSKGDQALDFSTSVNGRKSPNEDNSRSVSPNDMSNFSDNSDGSSDENMTAENFSELKIDVERFDDDDRDNSNMDDEESEAAGPSQATFGTSPNFSSYFQPSSYDGFPVASTSQPGPSTSTVCGVGGPSNNEGSDSILQDPTYYQDLLPRIGSNDNSWESLIEITKTSETSKLQQLVDNIEHKLIEPNQCIICHRVLSCKSALQMHYRTHTGERPFKCKLCSRAFTTKGNLKTHMGVHRTKPATRLMHQCPVCHKPYPNALLLQQHIRNHTENPNLQLAPLYASCEDRPPTLLPSYPRQFLLPPQLMNAEPLALTSNKPQEKNSPANESVIKSANVESNMSINPCSSPALSSAGSCSPTCNIDENVNKELQPPVLDIVQPDQDDMNEEKMNHSPSDIPKITEENNDSNDRGTFGDRSSPGEDRNDFDTNVKQELPNLTHSPKSFIANQDNVNISPSNLSLKSPPPKYNPSEHPLISLASDRPLPMTLPSDIPLPFSMHNSDRPYPPMSVPDFTTASLTALENHVKGIASNVSHPLPFPPPFGLGLNVPNFYRDYNYQPKTNSSPSASKNGSDGSADDRSTPGSAAPNSKGESPRSSAMVTQSTPKSENSNGIGALDLTPRNSPGFQRPAGTELKIYAPLAGLPFVSPHHRLGTTCQICYKTFACQSALEIHYRSHTKERPFRCEVCDRGFSTKGNMRQHMLTHKIRDLPAQVFTKSSNNSNSNSSNNNITANSNSNTTTNNNISSSSNNNNNNNINNSSTPTNLSTPPKNEIIEEKIPKKPSEEVTKRSPADISLPQPKRPPGQPKHLCQVCTKPFSSGSALQIHMRTHTGDKPFQCHICHRAFTTKGNLKVHMGTHMWNNSTSRRGRRMSLDISPLQLTSAAKPGEFTQASYFPYLSPFINGLPPPQPPPKMNEISVIQTAGVSNGAIVTAPPATTSSSAPSTPQQPLPLLSTSKREEQISSQNQNYLPGHC